MPLRLYNTLTKRLVDLSPRDPARMTFYSCGPTVYDDAHIGNVLRTQRGCKPVYISVGHRINLTQATEIILKCVGKYRIPIPTRDADLYVAQLKARTK